MKMHNSFTCSPHYDEDCGCEDRENEFCNPYWLPGYCPTDGAGDECFAPKSQEEYLAEGPPWMHDAMVSDPWLRDDAEEQATETIIVAGVRMRL